LGNYAFVYDGVVFHGHGGDGDGYLAHFAYSRDAGQGYFVVINAFNHAALRAMRESIQDYIVREIQRPIARQQIKLTSEQLAALSGDYRAVTRRFEWTDADDVENDRLRVFTRNGQLFTRFNDGRARILVPVTPTLFRRADEPVATIAFVEHSGERYVQGDFGNYVLVRD
jgi:hypothetical protein